MAISQQYRCFDCINSEGSICQSVLDVFGINRDNTSRLVSCPILKASGNYLIVIRMTVFGQRQIPNKQNQEEESKEKHERHGDVRQVAFEYGIILYLLFDAVLPTLLFSLHFSEFFNIVKALQRSLLGRREPNRHRYCWLEIVLNLKLGIYYHKDSCAEKRGTAAIKKTFSGFCQTTKQ